MSTTTTPVQTTADATTPKQDGPKYLMYTLVGAVFVTLCAIPLFILLGAHHDNGKKTQRNAPQPSAAEQEAAQQAVKHIKERIREQERAKRKADEAYQPPYKVKLDAKPRPIPMGEEEFI